MLMGAHQRRGTYYYFFPYFAQGRKVIWEGQTKGGRKFLDYIPPELVERTRDDSMTVWLRCGSVIQVIGTDNFDSIVGTNPVGCAYSEYAIQNPAAWELTQPILAENDGWAIFAFTPRGRNHAYKLYNLAMTEGKKKWYVQRLTVDDTTLEDGSRVVPQEAIEEARLMGMPEELIRQEFFCDFNAGLRGAYYASIIEDAEKAGRIRDVPIEQGIPVDTWWDLGMADSTAIIFTQTIGNEYHIVDTLEFHGESLMHYVGKLREKKYSYGTHYAPHDIKVRELSLGKSRYEFARSLGVNFQIVPKLSLQDGIDATRRVLSKCYFDRTRCAKLVDALRTYHREYDEIFKDFGSKPVKDWTSHYCDAFRYFGVGIRDFKRDGKKQLTADDNWSIFAEEEASYAV